MSLRAGGGEYTQSEVPEAAATAGGLQIAIVKIGVILALPAFITGAQIGFSMGLVRGTIAMVVGAAVLGVLAVLTGSMGALSRQSTALIVRYAFGTLGARIVSALIGVTLIGFFAVTAELFGKSLARLSESVLGFDVAAAPCIIGGGALMVLTSIYGFNGLKRLADVAAPVKFIGLAWIAWIAMRDRTVGDLLAAAPAAPASLGVGVSAVIGGLAAGVTIFPDLTRFARSAGHARYAAISSFAVAFPAILLLAAIPSVVTKQGDLVDIMVGMKLGLPAFVFLIFAAWTTNTSNLYSAALGLSSLFRRSRFALLAGAAGAAGVALALMGVTSRLIPFLVILGITIPPLAGVYLADFYLVRRRRYDAQALQSLTAISWPAFVAWGLAIAVALATAKGVIRLTGVPACDSILVAFFGYTTLSAIRARVMRRSAAAVDIDANPERQ